MNRRGPVPSGEALSRLEESSHLSSLTKCYPIVFVFPEKVEIELSIYFLNFLNGKFFDF